MVTESCHEAQYMIILMQIPDLVCLLHIYVHEGGSAVDSLGTPIVDQPQVVKVTKLCDKRYRTVFVVTVI